MSEVTGGCLCGALRYSFDRDAVVMAAHCHCTDCQKATGSGKATIILVPTGALQIDGERKGYTVTGTAGSHVTREFCPQCGSPVLSYLEEDPNTRFIKAGSLDDPAWVTVSTSFWGGSAHPWSPVDETTQTYAGNPDM